MERHLNKWIKENNFILFHKGLLWTKWDYLVWGNRTLDLKSAEYLLKYELKEIKKFYKNITKYQNPIDLSKIMRIHADMSEKQTKQDFINSLNNVTLLYAGVKRAKRLMKNRQKQNISLVHLICAHNKPMQLLRLIKKMAHPEVAFIIFIDNNQNIEKFTLPLSDFMKSHNVFFVSPRIEVEWGCWSVAFMELILLTAGVKFFPQAIYYSLRSGTDYQILPTELILDFFRKEYPKDFLEITQDKQRRSDMINWRLRHFFLKDYHLAEAVRTVFPNKKILDINYDFGSNWATLSGPTAKKMVDVLFKKPEIMEFFEYTWIPDEFIFQTLFNQVHQNVRPKNNLLYIYFDPRYPHPVTLNESFFYNITKNPCIFWARKFDINDSSSASFLDKLDLYARKLLHSKNYKRCIV